MNHEADNMNLPERLRLILGWSRTNNAGLNQLLMKIIEPKKANSKTYNIRLEHNTLVIMGGKCQENYYQSQKLLRINKGD